jgi:hypothetical protein
MLWIFDCIIKPVIEMKNKINETKGYNPKYRLGLVGFSCISASLILAIFYSVVLLQEAQAKEYQTRDINWGEICRNPIVDAVIVEPCNTLTTPDEYTLTKEGERVLACLVGGGLLLLIDPSGVTLMEAQYIVGEVVGCGGRRFAGIPVSDVFYIQ